MPMTPAPTTTIVRGTFSIARMPSQSMMRTSSNVHMRGPCRVGPDGDDDDVGGVLLLVVAVVGAYGERVLVDEAGRAVEQVHAVAEQLAAHDLDLATDHVRRSGEQVRHGDVLLHPVVLAVEVPHVHAGEVEDRLAQRLRRDRAGVDADAADHVPPLDDGSLLAELGRRDRRTLAARAGADDEQVVVRVIHGRCLPSTSAPPN